MKMLRAIWFRTFYQPLMRLAHRYNWHHATVCYPDGDTLYWCQWCGMRDVVKRRNAPTLGLIVGTESPAKEWLAQNSDSR